MLLMKMRIPNVGVVAITLAQALMTTSAMANQPWRTDSEPAQPLATSAAPSGFIGLAMGRSPFVPNEGQWADASIVYGQHTERWSIAFRESAIDLTVRRAREGLASSPSRLEQGRGEDAVQDDVSDHSPTFDATRLGLTFPGSNDVEPIGRDPTRTNVNYYVGGEGRSPASKLSTYTTVVYPNLYDGIDLHVRSDDATGTLKYEFHVDPGVDHTQIQMQYDGLDCPLNIDRSGALNIETSIGTLIDHVPVAHELIDGEPRDIRAEYELCGANTAAFTLASERDPALALIIDPEVEWMMYYGGSKDDYARGIALDHDGNIFVTGETWSTELSRSRNYFHGGVIDAMVCKISPDGSLAWITYLGGSDGEVGQDIAIDSRGQAIVVGFTSSRDIAATTNSFHGGDRDAFACAVNDIGLPVWFTYLGGDDKEAAHGVVIDNEDRAVISGWTYSTRFEGRRNEHHDSDGQSDAYVCRMNTDGDIEWMTYLGGTDGDWAYHVDTDSLQRAVVVGATRSTDFEGHDWLNRHKVNVFHGGRYDAFACLVGDRGDLQWMYYYGGTDSEDASGVTVTDGGDIYICGETRSADFAGRNNEHHGVDGEDHDIFVLRTDPSGILQWMTYLGGNEEDRADGERGNFLALGPAGNVFLTGRTQSYQFEGRLNGHHGSGDDALLAHVTPSGNLDWMLYFGGGSSDSGLGIAVDQEGYAYVCGDTYSQDFSGRGNENHGLHDVFVLKSRGPCLELANDGLAAGETTTWEIRHATPGKPVAVVYGFARGWSQISYQKGFCASFGIESVMTNSVIGYAVADIKGRAVFARRVPVGSTGLRVVQQAAQQGTCPDECVSNVLDQIVQ